MGAGVIAGLATTLVLLGTGVSSAGVVACHIAADSTIRVSSARNMTCRAAARDIHRFRGSISTHFRTPGGFRCRRVAGNRLEGQWRCVKGAEAYRIEFAD